MKTLQLVNEDLDLIELALMRYKLTRADLLDEAGKTSALGIGYENELEHINHVLNEIRS